MTLEQALEECRDLWIKMRDSGTNDSSDKLLYLTTQQKDYLHACPCCEFVYASGRKSCNHCPLFDFWNKEEDVPMSLMPCMNAENSPYKFFECCKGTPELANYIVIACEDKLRSLKDQEAQS